MEEKQHTEIDVIELGAKIIKEWKTLLKFICITTSIGIIVALATPRQYTAETILAPELSSGGLGMTDNLADIASSFGFDLGKKSSIDAIYPELYPDVFSSIDFILNLFNVPVRLKDDAEERTYLEHLLKDTQIPFWQYPRIWMSELFKKNETSGLSKGEKDPYRLSKTDSELCERISKSMICLIDKKTSEIQIGFTDQDPMVAAIMVDTLQHRLQSYITEYRTIKARTDYEYYKKMTDDSRKRYERAQHLYASFMDANTDLMLHSFKLKETQLENEMQLQYTVYNQMATQMKAAEAKVQERTPAFTIIQHPYMPVRPSSRPKLITVLIYVFLGIVLDVIWVLSAKRLFAQNK